MSDDIDELEYPQDEPEVQEAGEPEAPEIDPEIIETARKYGWRPKEEFRGNPDNWVEATRFVELPSTLYRMTREELSEVRKAREAEQKDFAARLEKIERASRSAINTALETQKAQYERDLSELKARQARAVEEGDTAEWQRLDAAREKMKAPEPVQPDPDAARIISEYRSKNTWIDDPVLFSAAYEEIERALKAGKVSNDTAEQLEYAERAVRMRYPGAFEKAEPKPAPRSKVDGGGLGAVPRAKGVNDLPPEAVKQGREFVADGIFPNLEAYAEAYHKEF